MEKVIRGVKICPMDQSLSFERIKNLNCNGTEGFAMGYAELYLSEGYVTADIFYDSKEMAIEGYTPVPSIQNNRIFSINMIGLPVHNSPVKSIGQQLKERSLEEEADICYDDF